MIHIFSHLTHDWLYNVERSPKELNASFIPDETVQGDE